MVSNLFLQTRRVGGDNGRKAGCGGLGGQWAEYKEESTMNGEEVWGGLGEHTCGGLNYVGSGIIVREGGKWP
jgi:hypothetical protein